MMHSVIDGVMLQRSAESIALESLQESQLTSGSSLMLCWSYSYEGLGCKCDAAYLLLRTL